VRVASVGKYPYRIFYRIAGDTVEILRIHHMARKPWDEQA
jgi:plasmid stabilization system protein ParE